MTVATASTPHPHYIHLIYLSKLSLNYLLLIIIPFRNPSILRHVYMLSFVPTLTSIKAAPSASSSRRRKVFNDACNCNIYLDHACPESSNRHIIVHSLSFSSAHGYHIVRIINTKNHSSSPLLSLCSCTECGSGRSISPHRYIVQAKSIFQDGCRIPTSLLL